MITWRAVHNLPPLIVTGAGGFVGSRFVAAAQAGGHQVVCLRRAGHLPASSQVDIISDGTVAGMTQALQPHAEAIIVHCAAAFSPADAPAECAELVEANLAYPTRLLQAGRAAGVSSWVNLGSLWEHDATGQRSPVNHYAQLKLAFQDTLSYFASRHGLRALTLKLSDTYGAGDTRPKLLNQLRDANRRGVPMKLTAGTQIVNLCHIDDIIRAMLIAVQTVAAQQPGFDAFHVVDGDEPMSVRDVIATANIAVGGGLDVSFGDVPVDGFKPQRIWTDGARLPGWAPQIDLLTGLTQFFAAGSHSVTFSV